MRTPHTPRPSLDSFKRDDGSTNWAAYNAAMRDFNAARVANGEQCSECGTFIALHMGHPDRCPDCRRVHDDTDEVDHGSRIRCPKCRRAWSVYDDGESSLFSEGEHDVTCECGHEFTVETIVSHTFTSPALLAEEATVDA